MKSSFLILTFFVAILIMVSSYIHKIAIQNPRKTISIDFAGKPIDTVLKYINGKWKLSYRINGFSGNVHRVDNEYWEFKDKNKLIKIIDNKTVTNTTYKWDNYEHDSICDIILFNEYWFLYGIYQDTLDIEENCPDCDRYRLIKD